MYGYKMVQAIHWPISGALDFGEGTSNERTGIFSVFCPQTLPILWMPPHLRRKVNITNSIDDMVCIVQSECHEKC
jgi:hypothetical protein